MPEPATPLAERPWENVERMLDVDAALDLVLAAFAPLPTELVPLLAACHRVLAADVMARDSVPPFRNSAMDGYAVRAEETARATWDAPVTLPVATFVAAGSAIVPCLLPGQAIRIMTGAPLPKGANAVVRFEETDEGAGARSADGSAVCIYHPAKPLDNVREAGEDIAVGTMVARRGQVLSPPDLGLLAAVGYAEVEVHRRPRVAILSTGDEVVPPNAPLTPGKIRDSNAFVLGALAQSWGAEVSLRGIARDTIDDLRQCLADVHAADLIVTSGGVSLGDFDLVKDVLRTEGEVNVWQVRMKPGKPLAFGRMGGTPLLGVPGNPVAAAVSFLLFARPAIRKMLGCQDVAPKAVDVVAAEPLDNRGHRRHYVRARLERQADGPPLAFVVGEQGAGILSSLAAADALLVVPEELERVVVGTRLSAMLLDW